MSHDPFAVFQIYHGVFLHFNSDYDYMLYHGKTSYKLDTFQHRKDKYSWHNVARQLEYIDLNMMEYYFAWCFYSEPKWVSTKLLIDRIVNFDLEWTNYGAHRVTNFTKDMVKVKTLEPARLMHQLLNGEIHWCTILVLDYYRDTINKMNEALTGQFLWDKEYKKLIKFRPFYLKHEPIHEIIFKPLIPETL